MYQVIIYDILVIGHRLKYINHLNIDLYNRFYNFFCFKFIFLSLLSENIFFKLY